MPNGVSTSRSVLWKFIERGSVIGCQFVIQIVMARLLDPSEYGILTIMTTFIAIAQVIVQTGLTSSIIQTKELDDEKTSSVFWINIIFSVILFLILLVCSPLIESYYDFDGFVVPFCVLTMLIPFAAIGSVQLSLLSRRMQFKKIMICSLVGVVVSGTVGIIMAFNNMGIWALVTQHLLHHLVNTLTLCVASRWIPKFKLKITRIKDMLVFGGRILVGNIIESIYDNIVSLMIGKKYDTVTLAYYDKGKKFPNMAASCVKEALQSVLMSSYSKHQDDKSEIRESMRIHIRISQFAMCAIMCILAVVSEPLISIILTDKWLPCAPYLKIACLFYMFIPVNTIMLQAINSIGRSDISLKTGILKRIIAIVLIFVTFLISDSVVVVAFIWAFTGLVNFLMNCMYIKKLFGYNVIQQIIDFIPYLLVASGVVIMLQFITLPALNVFLDLLLKAFLGATIYFVVVLVCSLDGLK